MARKLQVEIVGDARSYERSLKTASRDTQRFDRQISKTFRGAAAGSGIFKSLGRSLAFASGGFVAAAGVTDLLRGSIEQASEAAASQKQLAAQFKASGQNLATYKDQIDKATSAVSQLAGFEDDQLTRAFTTAFRGSEKVSVALRIQAVAADVARARHIDLQTAALALTKAYGGQAAALKRLGVLVPAQLHGMAALNFVQEKFAGQAQAGTTAQERFSAAFKNFEEVIGTALLPTFNKLLTSASKWLNNSENQKRVQKDVTTGAHIFGGAMNVVAKSVELATSKLNPAVDAFLLLKEAVKAAKIEVSSFHGQVERPVSGEDVFLRGSTQVAGVGVPTGPAAAGTRPRASLNFQLSLLQLQLAQAEITASKKDDRAVLLRLAALTREKITKTKDLAERTQLYQSLGSYTEQIRSIDEKAATDRRIDHQKELDAAKKAAAEAKAHAAKLKALEKQRQQQALARLTASQFRSLGLGPTGADIIPSGKELLKKLGKIKDQVKGTVLDTSENRKLLARIRETLVTGLGKLAPEVRQKIQELLDALDVDKAAKKKKRKQDFSAGFVTIGGQKFSAFEEAQLSPRYLAALRRAGVPMGAAALPPSLRPAGVTINGGIHLHGVQNVAQLENELAKRTKARAHPRRGR